MEIYVVKQGDNVDEIAYNFQVPVESLIYNNQLSAPYALAVGQALLIPGPAQEPSRSIWAGGYAYPYIQTDVLEETLPYLSGLLIFSYGFTEEGNLLPPSLDDNFMLQMSRQNSAEPFLVLTPLGADGAFNNYLIHEVVHNEEATATLLENLKETVQTKGFAGVDLDFEYILPQDREAYVSFVEKAREAMHDLGLTLSVALAPKTSDTQRGLLYEGMDYAALGEAADSVFLMTYEWGYTYGPPMAVAPLNQVRRVVEYAVTKIQPDKITLGIPNYGYDWTLPYQRGFSRAQNLTLQQAVALAIENDVPIRFDEVAMSPYFTYQKEEQEHEVWFEDVRSLREKFALVSEYDLRGVGYWQIMNLFRPNWILLSDTFQIQKTETI